MRIKKNYDARSRMQQRFGLVTQLLESKFNIDHLITMRRLHPHLVSGSCTQGESYEYLRVSFVATGPKPVKLTGNGLLLARVRGSRVT